LWVNFAFLGPDTDPDTQFSPDPVKIRNQNIARKCVFGSGSAFFAVSKSVGILTGSVADPDPHGSAFIWLSWIRICIGNADRIWIQAWKLTKISNKPHFLPFKKAVFLPS
jgi:hypothetical protein